MTWSSCDAWTKAGSTNAGKKASRRQYKSSIDGKDVSLKTEVEKMAAASLIDDKVMLAACTLMSINVQECNNRQCAAAVTSALFNLMVNSSTNQRVEEHREHSQEYSAQPSVSTAQRLQKVLSTHAGEKFGTLAKAMQRYRSILPSHLVRKVDEVNKAASYDRHNVIEDASLIKELEAWLKNTADDIMQDRLEVAAPAASADPMTNNDPWRPASNKESKGVGNAPMLKGKGIFVPPPLVQTIEKVVEKVVEVPTVQYIEKVVEAPRIEYIEKVVEKFMEVPRTFAVPMKDGECQAQELQTKAETDLSAPEAVLKEEWQKKADAHQAKYPGGTLPTELRSFSAFMQSKERVLETAEMQRLRCPCCGQLPWS